MTIMVYNYNFNTSKAAEAISPTLQIEFSRINLERPHHMYYNFPGSHKWPLFMHKRYYIRIHFSPALSSSMPPSQIVHREVAHL